MKKNTSAIIFDLDGTLVDSAPDLLAALNHVLGRANRRGLGIEQVRLMVGDGARAMIIKGFTQTGELPDEKTIDHILKDFLTYYGDNIAVRGRIFPGAEQVLKTLTEQGIQLALCTNKSLELAKKLMTEIGLAKYFTTIVGGNSFDYQKPDPRHLTSTLDMMDFTAGRAVMVGDSANDISAARAAALPVIAVSFGYSKTPVAELKPDAVIDHYDDFFDALKQVTIF